MNNIKTKVSFILFVIFITLYSTMYSPKLYFVSFLVTAFFILLEKTQLINGRLPITVPYKSIIITGLLLFGFIYLYNKYFKREGFQTNKNNDKKLVEIEKRLGEKLTVDLDQHIQNLLKKSAILKVWHQFNNFVQFWRDCMRDWLSINTNLHSIGICLFTTHSTNLRRALQ